MEWNGVNGVYQEIERVEVRGGTFNILMLGGCERWMLWLAVVSLCFVSADYLL